MDPSFCLFFYVPKIVKEAEYNFLFKVLAELVDYKHNKGIQGIGGKILFFYIKGGGRNVDGKFQNC